MSPIAISYPAAIVSDYASYSYYDIILIDNIFIHWSDKNQ